MDKTRWHPRLMANFRTPNEAPYLTTFFFQPLFPRPTRILPYTLHLSHFVSPMYSKAGCKHYDEGHP